MDEILQAICMLAQDQYGNYVVQVSTAFWFFELVVLFPILNTPSVPNCSSFDFFNPKFDHSSYSKIYTKHRFFCCGLLYQYKFFKSDLNLTMFAQIFWIKRVVKLKVKKIKRTTICNVGSNAYPWCKGRTYQTVPPTTYLLPLFQIIDRLTILILNLTARLIQKFVQSITFLLWVVLILLIQDL